LATAEPKGLTVVVVPFVSLLHDLTERAARCSVPAQVWDAKNVGDRVRHSMHRGLLFVAAEHAVSPLFFSYVKSQFELGWRYRVILDECHEYVLAGLSYRPALLGIRHLKELPVPLILLTATLPPTAEGLLQEVTGSCNPLQLRSPNTRRHNVQYVVSNYFSPSDQSSNHNNQDQH
jgi:superfamily II DNA helicase RecQ